jgi:glutamate racemase
MSTQAIGVFDSGIGGLTVVRELLHAVPQERLVYFGDTARVPYGSKSVETVLRYAKEDTELLLSHDVKMIVIACNTVSAIALNEVIEAAAGIPVIGMIEPCAKEAVMLSRGVIGIIGTEATIASGAYEAALAIEAKRQSKKITTYVAACPLFVPLAEEGWTDHGATELIAQEYLSGLRENGVDTLILGCTHYPVLANIIQRVMGASVTLINSGAVAARQVEAMLGKHSTTNTTEPKHTILVSDVPRKFQRVGERFLGRELPEARQVVFKEAWVVKREAIATSE